MRLWQRIFLASFAVIMVMTGVLSSTMMRQQMNSQIRAWENTSWQFHEGVWLDVGHRMENGMEDGNGMIVTDETWAEVLHRLSVDDIYRGQALAVSVLYLDAVLADQKLADGQTVFTTDSWIELDEPQTDHAMPEPGQMISRIAQAGGSLFFVSVSCGEMYGRTVYVQSQQDMTEWMKNYDRQLARLRWGMLGLSLAAGGLLMLVVKWSLRSLTKVSGEIHEISEGNYGKKLEIKGSSEVAELAADVDVMSGKIAENMRQLSETSERQKQFIHNMAHEMKTPLTSIIGFSDILSIKERVTDKERQEYAEIIGKEAQRMEDLSAKLMELFHMQQGNLDRLPVALDERVNAVVRTMQPVMARKRLHVSVSLERAIVQGDVVLIDSLFYNLLDNARKACDENGHIDVRLANTGKDIRIVIADDGVGMSQETIERISEPFYMADKARSRSEGGAGLGMALCQEIVHLHGAKWQIQSEPGKGSRITVIWPAVHVETALADGDAARKIR